MPTSLACTASRSASYLESDALAKSIAKHSACALFPVFCSATPRGRKDRQRDGRQNHQTRRRPYRFRARRPRACPRCVRRGERGIPCQRAATQTRARYRPRPLLRLCSKLRQTFVTRLPYPYPGFTPEAQHANTQLDVNKELTGPSSCACSELLELRRMRQWSGLGGVRRGAGWTYSDASEEEGPEDKREEGQDTGGERECTQSLQCQAQCGVAAY